MWKILEIEPTTDSKAIRKAYAKKLRQINPSQQMADFQALNTAFDQSITWAKNQTQSEHNTKNSRENLPLQKLSQKSSTSSITPVKSPTVQILDKNKTNPAIPKQPAVPTDQSGQSNREETGKIALSLLKSTTDTRKRLVDSANSRQKPVQLAQQTSKIEPKDKEKSLENDDWELTSADTDLELDNSFKQISDEARQAREKIAPKAQKQVNNRWYIWYLLTLLATVLGSVMTVWQHKIAVLAFILGGFYLVFWWFMAFLLAKPSPAQDDRHSKVVAYFPFWTSIFKSLQFMYFIIVIKTAVLQANQPGFLLSGLSLLVAVYFLWAFIYYALLMHDGDHTHILSAEGIILLALLLVAPAQYALISTSLLYLIFTAPKWIKKAHNK